MNTTKRSVIVSAVLAIALCVSLIVGATFALFTSESQVNVAVTSGKVDVTASVDESSLDLYSPTSIAQDGTITNADDAADHINNKFANGGTAVIDGDTLTLGNMSAGDKVTFTINIDNNSTVAIKYRTIISCAADDGLFGGLEIQIGADAFNGTVISSWSDAVTEGVDQAVEVLVRLPADAGNEYQGKSCTLTYKVEAVQGNAEVVNPRIVYTLDELTTAINDADCAEIMLGADIENTVTPMQGATPSYTYKLTRNLTIDIGGYTLTSTHRLFKLSKANSSDDNGATLTLKSSGVNGKIYINQGSGGDVYGFVVDGGCTLNIYENVTIDLEMSYRGSANTIILNNGTVNMYGGKLIGRNIVVIASHLAAEGIFNMTGGEINVDAQSTGIQQVYSGRVTLTKGSITGNGKAYDNRGSTFDISTDFVIENP